MTATWTCPSGSTSTTLTGSHASSELDGGGGLQHGETSCAQRRLWRAAAGQHRLRSQQIHYVLFAGTSLR